MKRALRELKGYAIKAKDGTKGTIKDFLFDEESWTMRYMVADLGKLLPGRQVLIPRVFLDKSDWGKGLFHVLMTKEDIEKCPELAEHLPVSREYEALLHQHYQIDYYWPVAYATPLGTSGMTPATPVRITEDVVKEEYVDSNLRSFKEVTGYRVECADKKRGHLKDFVIDDERWQIVYIIVDIGHWYTRSKKVMLAANWMKKINYADKTISISQHSSLLEDAPEFDPQEPVNIEYEKHLYDFYGRKTVKA